MGPDAGVLIREARQAARLTQAELARRMGTTQSVVARLESRRSNPRFRTLTRAIEATGNTLAASVRPAHSAVDESLIAGNLRMPPGERLRQFTSAYRNVSRLTRQATREP